MTQQASSPIQNDASLEALVETERRLEQQLDEGRRRADERVKQARAAAQERIAHRRQQLAAVAAEHLVEGQRACDERLSREAQEKEEELARTLAGLEVFRTELSARMLAEVLGR